MDAFRQSFSAGGMVAAEFSQQMAQIDTLEPTQRTSSLTELVEATSTYASSLREELRQGRDRLLELNSCNPQIAAQVIESIRAEEKADELAQFMTQVFDIFGVEYEPHSQDSFDLDPH